MPALLVLAGVLAGIAINVLGDALPRARRIQVPRCAGCDAPRHPLAWSGIIALVTRHSRCPQCNARLSSRHLIVELIAPLLFLACWEQTGTTRVTLFRILYVAILILIAVTDIEHRLIPHVVSLPGIALAIAGAYLSPAFDSPKRALLGGAIGLAAALVLFAFGALFASCVARVRGEPLPGPALGFGDVTLSAFLGLILGAPDIIFALVIGILAGFLGAVAYLVGGRALGRQHALFGTFLPYGPFLIFGGAVMLFFGEAFMAWYIGG
ncbi:MAG: prepilin peptidase [Anaerolineae bacterium]|nr:prepilin peptidase [Anaerolineae bacterium]